MYAASNKGRDGVLATVPVTSDSPGARIVAHLTVFRYNPQFPATFPPPRHGMIRILNPLLLGLAVALPQSALAQDPFPADSAIQAMIDQRVESGWSTGIVLGIIRPDGRKRFFVHGQGSDGQVLNERSIMEIGSITKVFTGILLAEMTARGEVKLQEPVQALLPTGTHVPERNGQSITLLDLTTHTSGLPRLPANLHPKDPADPYADYSDSLLYDFLASYILSRDIGSRYMYSNLGAGLLGHALATRARVPYELLLRQRVLDPLRLRETVITMKPELQQRLVIGHNADGEVVPPWTFTTLAPAGALHSTARDLLSFLEANLDPRPRSPLHDVLRSAREPHRSAGDSTMMVGLGWHIWKGNGQELVWHNGQTAGFHSFIGLDTTRHVAVVILSSSMSDIDDLGFHLLDQLRPLVASRSIAPVSVPDSLLQQYVGEYQLAPAFSIVVEKAGSRLTAQATGQPKISIYPSSLNEFFLRAVEARVSFERDSSGALDHLILYQNGRELQGKKIK
ncbi:MAG: serine hydrolase [Gemmatimonadota bacterium]